MKKQAPTSSRERTVDPRALAQQIGLVDEATQEWQGVLREWQQSIRRRPKTWPKLNPGFLRSVEHMKEKVGLLDGLSHLLSEIGQDLRTQGTCVLRKSQEARR